MTTATSHEERILHIIEKQLAKSIVFFVKLKTEIIQKRVGVGRQRAGKEREVENVVREAGGCGIRVVLEVHRNHIKKRS